MDMSVPAARPSKVRRYEALDCLRGLAALSVLLGHTIGQHTANYPLLKALPLRILIASHSAVILFYVISGFALFVLYETMQRNYRGFVLSRVLRLYPVYLASIAVALTFVMIAQSAHLMWFGQTPNIRWLDILAHIGMIVPFDYTLYNGPIWSLIHEMRISLFFPLIYWAVRTHAAAAVGFFTVLSLSLAATHWHTVFAPKYPELVSVTATLHYTTLFVYGAAFAKQRALIVGTFAALPGRTALLAAVFFLLVYAYLQPDYHRIGPEWVIDLCVGAAACGIIALASSRIALEKYAAIRYLGKISFSLYLIHVPIILLILSTLSGRIGTPYVVGLSILASMWGADILWRLVETRALRWSREARRLSTAAVLVKEG